MKKLFVLAALMVLPLAKAHSRVLDIPQGPSQALAGADYGGVDIATVTYSSANVLLFGKAGGSISWIHFASAPAAGTDFAIIRATRPVNNDLLTPGAVSGGPGPAILTNDFSTNNEVFRLYVSSSLTNNYNGLSSFDPLRGFDYAPKTPMRLPAGATFKLNSVNWGTVTIGYTKFGE